MTQRWQPLPRWAGAGSLGANQPPPFTETPTRRAGGRGRARVGQGRHPHTPTAPPLVPTEAGRGFRAHLVTGSRSGTGAAPL